MKVLVFGSVNKDYVYSVDHIVRPGETISCSESSIFWGGKGFNQAVAVAKGGADCGFACKIYTNDKQEVNGQLNKYGIENGYIQTDSAPTGQAIIQIDRDVREASLAHILHAVPVCIVPYKALQFCQSSLVCSTQATTGHRYLILRQEHNA
jgi:ribokinase